MSRGGVAVLVDSRPESTASMVETAIQTSGPLVFDSLIDLSFHRLDLPAAIATLAGLPVPPPGGCTIEGDPQGNRLQGPRVTTSSAGREATTSSFPVGGTTS